MPEDQQFHETQTQTETETHGNTQWELMDNQTQAELPQKVTWGQLFTKKITIIDNVRQFVVFQHPREFSMTDDEWQAGRGESLNFVLKDEHFPQAILTRISKVHFRITRDLKRPLSPVFIEDLSRNGTFVQGKLVGKDCRRILRSNDVISIINPEYKLFVFHDMRPDLSQNLPKIITGKYYIGPELGAGACGVVKLVYDVVSCREYAMKHVIKNKLDDPGQKIINDPERVMNEVAIMKSLAHPCIVRMFDIYDRPDSVFMVLELMRGGDMISRISKMPQRRLSESSAKFFFIQMCEAIKYLHDKGITHRDIKPDNILLATDEEDTLLKVTDFGLSKFVKKHSVMKTLCGTPQYVAPEILTTRGKGSYTKKVDIWSMGCCLYACLAGSLPFTGGDNGDIQNIANDIVRGSLRYDPARWSSVSISAQDVVTKCLTKNPAKRPSIEDLRIHRWLNDERVIARVEQVMGIPVLQERLMRNNAPGPSALQKEVVTNRVRATAARTLFLFPEMKQRINNVRGSTPPIVAVPRPMATAAKEPARNYQDGPPLKKSRMER